MVSSTKRTVAASSAASSSAGSRPAKRVKAVPDDTGRLTTAALLSEHTSATHFAVRPAHSSVSSEGDASSPTSVLPLSSICLRVVVDNFRHLFLSETTGQVRSDDEDTRTSIEWLRLLPSRAVNRLLQAVLDASEEDPDHRIATSAITSLFFRTSGAGTSSSSSSSSTQHIHITQFSLPATFFRAAQSIYDPNANLANSNDPENILSTISGRSKQTLTAEQNALKRASRDREMLLENLALCTSLRSLDLAGQNKLQDETLARLLSKLPQLAHLNVKGCTAIGDVSIRALAKTAGKNGNLKHLNLNYTAVTVKGLKSLLARCKSLEVLKLANVNGLTDAAVAALLDPKEYLPEDWQSSPFQHLTSLKLRSTKIGDHGLRTLLPLCPTLQTLDISYTAIRSLDMLADAMHTSAITLRKLSISGLSMRTVTGLEKFFRSYSRLSDERRNSLKILKLGTLDLDNPTLTKLVPYLEKFEGLERVSLFGNTKLATGLAGGLARFISSIGRFCDTLDLSQIKLPSNMLAQTLIPPESYDHDGGNLLTEQELASPLRVLILDNTHTGDSAALAISCLSNLVELYLEQGTITVDGLKTIMSGCPKLRLLNLKGCRSIPVVQRRRWFEMYEAGTVGEED